jgi:hypothetical protein
MRARRPRRGQQPSERLRSRQQRMWGKSRRTHRGWPALGSRRCSRRRRPKLGFGRRWALQRWWGRWRALLWRRAGWRSGGRGARSGPLCGSAGRSGPRRLPRTCRWRTAWARCWPTSAPPSCSRPRRSSSALCASRCSPRPASVPTSSALDCATGMHQQAPGSAAVPSLCLALSQHKQQLTRLAPCKKTQIVRPCFSCCALLPRPA